ncbi:15759_t:CDS:2, partial [Funneliformis geosporum]
TTFLMNLTITMDSEQQSKEKQNQAAEQQQLIPALENETVLSLLWNHLQMARNSYIFRKNMN